MRIDATQDASKKIFQPKNRKRSFKSREKNTSSLASTRIYLLITVQVHIVHKLFPVIYRFSVNFKRTPENDGSFDACLRCSVFITSLFDTLKVFLILCQGHIVIVTFNDLN